MREALFMGRNSEGAGRNPAAAEYSKARASGIRQDSARPEPSKANSVGDPPESAPIRFPAARAQRPATPRISRATRSEIAPHPRRHCTHVADAPSSRPTRPRCARGAGRDRRGPARDPRRHRLRSTPAVSPHVPSANCASASRSPTAESVTQWDDDPPPSVGHCDLSPLVTRLPPSRSFPRAPTRWSTRAEPVIVAEWVAVGIVGSFSHRYALHSAAVLARSRRTTTRTPTPAPTPPRPRPAPRAR
jgi:hypothetical protein